MARVGKRTIDAIEQALLAEGPTGPHFDRNEESIWITNQPGQHVDIRADWDGREIIVSAGQWHEHFDDGENAASCFMWLLTPYYRTVEIYAGETHLLDRLERWDVGGWTDLGGVYFLNPTDSETHALAQLPTWRYIYRQQSLIRPAQPLEEVIPGVQLDDHDLPPESVLGVYEVEGPPESFEWAADIPHIPQDGSGFNVPHQPSWLHAVKSWFRRR